MADELNLKALRAFYENASGLLKGMGLVDKEEPTARFILSQIKHVEECGSKGTGWKQYFQHTIECLCKKLRADLLKLQREVLG